MKMIKIIIALCMVHATAAAQNDSLLNQLETDSARTDYITASFKSTRLIHGHSVENIGKGVLDVRILHRFAPVNTGLYNMFGLDQASMRMGFDYGITNNIMVGFGRSTWQKTYDALIKVRILRQSTGAVNMPVTLSWVSTFATRTDLLRRDTGGHRIKPGFGNRTSFAHQVLVARKFSERFSLQVMPTFIHHHNRVDSINFYTQDKDNLKSGNKRKNSFAIGMGGRLKVSKRVSITAEYYYQLPDAKPDIYFNSIAFGVDIETGGHVFQLHFTNSNGMTEKSFITDTDDKWTKGYIRFGFNLSRVFNIGKR
jgi:opacity protein-like surface antigen